MTVRGLRPELTEPRFADRRAAGRSLAIALADRSLRDPFVLALARGGVPVGFEVASTLHANLDVLVARKVGAPGHEEVGIGAIAEGGVVMADPDALRALAIDDDDFAELAATEQVELRRRLWRYRGDRALPSLAERDALLVDDGLATGVTAEASIAAVRRLAPRRVLLCVPVCAPRTAARLSDVADEVVCVMCPERFVAVGASYERFEPTTDGEVLELLDRARAGFSRSG